METEQLQATVNNLDSLLEEKVDEVAEQERIIEELENRDPEIQIREVTKEIIKEVDSPALLQKIADLEDSLEEANNLVDDLKEENSLSEAISEQRQERLTKVFQLAQSCDAQFNEAMGIISEYKNLIDLYILNAGASVPTYSTPTAPSFTDDQWTNILCPPGTIRGRYGPYTCG